MKFGLRRLRNTTLVMFFAYITITALDIIELSIQVQQYTSGWLLVALMTVLVAFYIKKKLSILPLGSGATWAQWHYYLGFFLFAIYLKHVEFTLPNGVVEIALTSVYFIVMTSGVLGVLINRTFARRLSYLEEEVLFERIPEHWQTLRQDVERLILESVEKSGSTTLSDYYLENLFSYFRKPHFIFSLLLGSNYGFIRVKEGLNRQIRYLNSKEAEYALLLDRMIHKKNLLDTHFALQRVLKTWGVLHSPVSILLILLTFIHVVLVYAFRGAA